MNQVQIISIEAEESPEADFILKSLRAYNASKAGPSDAKPITLVIRNDNGEITAGLTGATSRKWLFVEHLWVHDSLRLLGLGSQLLIKAESLAKERGCLFAHLDTFSFQGPGFYLKHGYEKFGELGDYPPGHSRFYMRKAL